MREAHWRMFTACTSTKVGRWVTGSGLPVTLSLSLRNRLARRRGVSVMSFLAERISLRGLAAPYTSMATEKS